MKRMGFLALLIVFTLVRIAADHDLPDVPFPIPHISEGDRVGVYADHAPDQWGRSETRASILRYEIGSFAQSVTFPTTESEGILTAIVVDERIHETISTLLESTWFVNLGEYELWKHVIGITTAYIYRNPLIDLEFTFSLERPQEPMLEMIRSVYRTQPEAREAVLDRYRNNYVVRIHSAKNFIDSGTSEITFTEALVMATLIGDRFQWLWGIHDGNGILFSLPDH